MTNSHASQHAAFGRSLKQMSLGADDTIHWGCSMKGWNCCVDKGIVVRPYDMVRLRHAVSKPAHEITSDNTVTFAWHGPTGALVGSLAHKPYEGEHVACTFYDEITNLSAARMREEDPERFASMPLTVQRAADATASNEYRVAGLCQAHHNRPEVCRAFPFQRETSVDDAGVTTEHGMMRVNACGSCALSTPTTPRQTVESEDIGEYWRAHDVFNSVAAYFRSRGAAKPDVELPQMGGYQALPISDVELAELWGAMYLADRDVTVVEQHAEQWRAELDVDGDRAIYLAVMEHALDRVDAAVAASGLALEQLGVSGHAPLARPNIEVMLDPARPFLMLQAVA
ncbi:MAG: YkgJ family cysteine cluster protein [Chloroflexota bacterium]